HALAATPSSDVTARPTAECDAEAERQREEAALASLARAEQRLAEVVASTRPTDRPTAPLQRSHPNPKAATLIQQIQAARSSRASSLTSSPAPPRGGPPS